MDSDKKRELPPHAWKPGESGNPNGRPKGATDTRARSLAPHMWKPGQSGNPKGRTKGSKNRVPNEIRARFREIVENRLDDVYEALDRVNCEDPAKFLDMLAKLSTLFLPKMTEDVTANKPPVFILPAGVEAPNNDYDSDEEEYDEEEDDMQEDNE